MTFHEPTGIIAWSSVLAGALDLQISVEKSISSTQTNYVTSFCDSIFVCMFLLSFLLTTRYMLSNR
jgi:hypothetical protein